MSVGVFWFLLILATGFFVAWVVEMREVGCLRDAYDDLYKTYCELIEKRESKGW